jgi:adenine/guanine phosphoribosyltransferase-like PRPP-binding protein
MNEKLKQELKNKIRIIPNFPKKGILFQDVTSITDNSDLFKKVIRELSIYAKKIKFQK